MRQWLSRLTLRERVAQLVMAPCYGDFPNTRSKEYRQYVRWVRDLRVGGLIVVNRVRNGRVRHAEPYAMAAFLNRMQRLAKTPLLAGGDFERGASMRVETDTKFPHNMAFAAAGDVEMSRFEGQATAREARALGVHWIFAPVADVNSNPDNPIINIRAYGEDPQTVASHVLAYIDGARSDPAHRVLTTVKHFPGHGDTAVDTHLGLATLNTSRERLDSVELVPFRAAIERGVDSVMSAHIAVPALDATGLPATLAPGALTKLLREELGFKGLIVTDALDMKGVANHWNSAESAVKAVQAGADVLLMPPDPEQAINAVVRAVERGVISRKRIDDSVRRILAAKVSVGLHRRRVVNLETVNEDLNTPEAAERIQEIADRAVTLVKNESDAVPLPGREGGPACFLALAESLYSESGRTLQEEVKKREPEARVTLLDPMLRDTDVAQVVRETEGCGSVVAAAFVSVASYRGDVALSGHYPELIKALLQAKRRVILVSLGNPYLLRSFPQAPAYLATYSTVEPAEIAAVKALYGEIPIQGRLPVSIPGQAKLGDGLQVPAVRKQAINAGAAAGR